MKKLAWLALALALGCASAPPEPLDEAAAVKRALDDARAVFATRVRGDGAERADLDVVTVTTDGIAWRVAGDEGQAQERRLVWRDVENIESQSKDELPSRAESLYLLLARGSRSVASSDAVVPAVVGDVGVARGYVELRDRPRGSRLRLANALEVLEAARNRAQRRAPATATVAPVASPSVGPISSEELERELRALERMKRDGLIDDATYARKRRELLSRY